MATNDFASHTGSDGAGAIERIRRYYPYDCWLGETIAAGYKAGNAVVSGWEQSEPHREILLRAEFHAIGLALAVNSRARYRWYWTCNFGGHVDT
jgi:uncharacterized protein YkwD